MRLAVLLFMLCCALVTPVPLVGASTSSPPPHFERLLTIRDGLSNNAVTALHQDRLGFLWVGTRDGLNRFDGYEFIPFLTRRRDNACAGTILAITETTEGRIWAATPGGIAYLDPDHERFHCLDKAALGLPAGRSTIFDLTSTPDGHIWAATGQGLVELATPSSGEATVTLHTTGSAVPLTQVLADPDGSLWTSDQHGTLYHYMPHTQRVLRVPQPETAPTPVLYALTRDAHATLWLMGQNLLRTYDPATKAWATVDLMHGTPSDPLVAADFRAGHAPVLYSMAGEAFAVDQTDRTLRLVPDASILEHGAIGLVYRTSPEHLWVGSLEAGLLQRQANRGRFSTLWEHFPALQATPTVGALAAIADGRLLAGVHHEPGRASLHLLDPHAQQRTNLSAQILGVGEVGSSILAIEGSLLQQDRFFVSTLTDGLLDLNLRGKPSATTLALPDSIVQIQALAHTEAQTLVLGSRRGALFRYDLANSTIEQVQLDAPLPRRIRTVRLYAVYDVWYASFNDQLFRLDPQARRAETVPLTTTDGSSPGLIFDIHPGPQGALWVAAAGGLYRAASSALTPAAPLILEAVEALQGTSVQSLRFDASGALWLVGAFGVSRYQPSTGTLQAFTELDGLPTFTRSPVLKTVAMTGSRLFFGTDGHGVIATRTASARTPALSPPLHLTRFASRGLPAQHFVSKHDTLSIAFADKAFAFEFALLNFDIESRQRYQYRLRPFEESWQAAETRRYASYTNLAPGSYTLEVRAQDASGVWSSLPLSKTVIVTPPWYRTAQAYLGFMLLFVGFGALTGWVIKRRHAREIALLQREATLAEEKRLQDAEAHRKLQAVDALRRTFLENMSHELRTPLAGIVAATDILAFEDLGELNEIVGIISESGSRLEKTLLSILEFSEIHTLQAFSHVESFDLGALVYEVCKDKALEARAKHLALDVVQPPQPVRVHTSRHYMTQVLTHVIDNAIKFTQRGRIEVTLRLRPEAAHIEVRDTGIGMSAAFQSNAFTPFKQESEGTDRRYEGCGLGLSIAKHALLLMQGDVHIESAKGQGTAVHVALPLPARQAEPLPAKAATVQPMYYAKAS